MVANLSDGSVNRERTKGGDVSCWNGEIQKHGYYCASAINENAEHVNGQGSICELTKLHRTGRAAKSTNTDSGNLKENKKMLEAFETLVLNGDRHKMLE